ncbi:MBL fold metallo-hydrolase [Candidatus Atribacteria bacterium MT.SAG.1]|nr:MBL fold metallo-hydrolase [Candidatus Atribacteria bacterium MT.SAG.1]
MIDRRKLGLLAILFLFSANLIVWQIIFYLNKENFLEVTFFDIGQGDAIFIRTPYKSQILIDGGPNSMILGKLAEEMPFWDKTIDLIILTHPERDHIAGLLSVLESYNVKRILWTGVVRNTSQYDKWKEMIEKENAEIIIANNSQKIKIGNVFLDILYPFESLEGKEIKNSNDTSIVSRLSFGNNSFLFTGDATKVLENKIISNCKETENCELNSDVLKVGHHGSKTSTSKEFLENILPDIAVILSGKDNPYKHPHEQVLKNLEELGINILRTDQKGDIKIVSNGSYLIINK